MFGFAARISQKLTRRPRAGFSAVRRHPGARSAVATAAAIGLLASALIGIPADPAAAADPCAPTSNKIACENSKPGTDPFIWDIGPTAGDTTIQGFSTDISVNVGTTIGFKIKTPASSYKMDIYRTGYYQGLGARFITSVTPSASLPQTQPPCAYTAATELTDCGNWGLSASWAVPATAVSGVYVALLTRNDTGGQSHIIFVVRDDSSTADVLFQTSDTTWQAYNTYGGSDFYQGAGNGRAYKLSYNRPIVTRSGTTARDFYFSSEFAQVQFMERNGYDMTYAAGVDTDRYGSLLLNHKVFLSVGHDEYWSTGQRANVEAARDAGVNLQFLSGNSVYWHTRYEASTVGGTSNGYRTMVSYKETWSNAKIDPSPTWTGTWRDPRFAPPSAGAGVPENGLMGTMYMANDSDLPITVTSLQGKTRLWRGTSLTSLAAGASAALAAHTVGYESDEVIDNGFSPAGLIKLSTTVGSTPQRLTDFGTAVAPGTTTHNLTLYRAPSGALVFGAGTIQWAWGLSNNHDGNGAAPDARIQQAQVNLLADMSAQPATLMTGLVAAAKSTDSTPPTVTVTAPAANATQTNGSNVTVTGTAQDVGGVVAGVEVSTDGGVSWHPATGTSSWTYSYSQSGAVSATIRVRAMDDSANISAATTVALNVTGSSSVFGSQVPLVSNSGDSSAVELGLQFSPDISGFVTGVRFYKSTANTGVHTGRLWSSAGSQLAQVTFANETASGWQTALFSAPVAVVAGQTYVVSYTAPVGRYASDNYYWAYSSRLSPPLTIARAYGQPSPGVYGNPGAFPASSFKATNYYVDLLFSTQNTAPIAVSSLDPIANSTCVAVSTVVTALLSGAVSSASLGLKTASGTSVAGTSAYNAATGSVTFTPSAALTTGTSYTATITATGSAGPLTTGNTWSFTTIPSSGTSSCPTSILPSSELPVTPQVLDSAVTLGISFSSSTNGTIVGMKFYKGPGNTGTHVGTLWSSTGTQLATATFAGETASGWQTVYFSQPVAVTAGTKYVASYRTTTGSYSVTAGRFSSAYTNGLLTVPAGGAVYNYSAAFPSTSSTTNYFVDVLFASSGAPVLPSVVSRTPGTGATGVSTAATISAVLSADPGTTIPTVSVTTGSTTVAGTTSYNATSKTLTFTPSTALAVSTSYSVVVASGATALTGGTWSFTTAASGTGGLAYNLITDTPTSGASTDSSAVELGMAFTPSQAGSVTAIRFYKDTGSTGTHTGSLWSSTGTRLATVTFTGESATGWQTATLATPVALQAGTMYVVSYYAPVGRYSVTYNYFSTPRANGPLTADSVNGRYLYASGGGFPTSSYNASNYYVDVTFVTSATPAPVTVVSKTPASAATGVATTTTVSATMSGASSAGTPTIAVTGPSGAVAGTSTYDSVTLKAVFTPTAALSGSTSYTATVTVAGTALGGGTWSFTTGATSYSLTPGTPTTAAENDSGAVELGMAFSSSQGGTVSAIRFYKGTGNTGTHTGSLWSTTGTRLATVTFTGESATGWQTANLATPYTLTAGTSYIVSYFAPNGRYASTGNYFTTPRTSGPLTADTTNGRYVYASTGGFPSSTYNSTNYFVDVIFTPTAPPVVTLGTVTPAAGATNVARTVSVTAAVTGANAATATLTLTGPSGAIAGTSTYSAGSGSVTFVPSSSLGWSTSYTASVFSGTTQIGSSWSFTTAAAPPPAVTLGAVSPTAGATNVARTVSVTAAVTGADAATASLTLTGPSGAIAGTSTYSAGSGSVTFVPSSSLGWSTSYTASVFSGATQIGSSWSFTTAAAPPPAVTLGAVSPTAGATDVAPTVSVTAAVTGADAATATLTLTGPSGAIAGTSTYSAGSGSVTFAPTNPLGWSTSYTASVFSGATQIGSSWSFTTTAEPATLPAQSIFAADAVPANVNWNDPVTVQVGTRFSTSVAGTVTSIRFYKGPTNTGTHTGYVWSATGTQLATVSFTGETASGWQQATLSSPLALTPGVEYRVGLLSTTGMYAVDLNGLATATTSGALSTPANGGAYVYGSGFLSNTVAHNYWVDVVFVPSS